jgi:hypothetical protein
MNRTERLLATQELHALLMDYWHEVDTNWGQGAAEYYTEDAVFQGPEATYQGRDKIRQFYEWRQKRGSRLAVHAVSNFRVDFESESRATSTWYLLLYAADGVPVLPTHPPIQIALVTDTCVRDSEGAWRYAYRKFEAWFQGGTPPTNPKL